MQQAHIERAHAVGAHVAQRHGLDRIVEAPRGHPAIAGRATSGPFTLVLRKSSRAAATASFEASWGKLWPAACDRSGIGALQQKKGCALCEGTIVKKD
jgi:hypothetical protein